MTTLWLDETELCDLRPVVVGRGPKPICVELAVSVDGDLIPADRRRGWINLPLGQQGAELMKRCSLPSFTFLLTSFVCFVCVVSFSDIPQVVGTLFAIWFSKMALALLLARLVSLSLLVQLLFFPKVSCNHHALTNPSSCRWRHWLNQHIVYWLDRKSADGQEVDEDEGLCFGCCFYMLTLLCLSDDEDEDDDKDDSPGNLRTSSSVSMFSVANGYSQLRSGLRPQIFLAHFTSKVYHQKDTKIQ